MVSYSRIQRLWHGALCTLLFAPLACETSMNPATGRREWLLMSPAEERQLDAMAAQQIEAQSGLAQDAALGAYVESVGQRMAAFSPRQNVLYSFQIVEMDEPNAFALPGGRIYVSRGLLVLANSETELANVLGHEIAHVAARHAARQDAHMRTLGLATLISDMMSGGEIDQPESERISGHFGARYARNQEREADRIGQDLALAAGVDPLGMPRFLQSLDHLTKLEHGSSQQQTYFSSHPATPERVAEATTAAHARRWREPALGVKSKPALSDERDRELYLDRIDGMPVQRPAYEGVFRENRFLHPDLGFSLRFPPGWRTHNEPSQVFAVAPFRDGVVLMHGPSLGDDPRAAAEDFATREGLELENPQVLRIAGLSAYRAKAVVRTRLGAIDAEITWIAYGGHVYPLLAGMEPGARRKYRALFRRFAHGFRPLSDEERDSVRELRLRSVRALEGESLAALSTRSGNQWDLLYTAVANGLQVDTRLEEGQRIKIARLERYEPEPPEPGEPADEPGAAASGFGPTR